MSQGDAEIEMIDGREETILNELEEHPQGLGFNELYRRVGDQMAQKTLSERLSRLLEAGLIDRDPDPESDEYRKGQKITYQSTDGLRRLNNHIEQIRETAQEYRDEIQEILDKTVAGEISEGESANQCVEVTGELVSEVMSLSFHLGFIYWDGRTREYLLMQAFEECNEVYSMMLERVGEQIVDWDEVQSDSE